MSTRVIIESKSLIKIFLVICIIWVLYCLTCINNNLSRLSSEAETINRQLSQINNSIMNN